jgi:cytochrome b561
MIKNTNETFGTIAKLFHWVTVGLFCYLFYLAITMTGMEWSPETKALYGEHKQYGVIVLGLVILRLIWKFMNATPQQQAGTAGWKIFLAKLTHFALYIIMLGFPISGMLMSMSGNHPIIFFGYEIPNFIGENKSISEITKTIHGLLEYITYGVVGLHVVGALYHHFIEKDNVLKRMLPFGK